MQSLALGDLRNGNASCPNAMGFGAGGACGPSPSFASSLAADLRVVATLAQRMGRRTSCTPRHLLGTHGPEAKLLWSRNEDDAIDIVYPGLGVRDVTVAYNSYANRYMMMFLNEEYDTIDLFNRRH